MLGLDDPYWAWCYDEVAWIWSAHIDSELQAASEEHKERPAEVQMWARRERLKQLLEDEEQSDSDKDEDSNIERKPPAGRFRDPAAMFGGS